VSHVTIWINTDGEGALAELEELARGVLG